MSVNWRMQIVGTKEVLTMVEEELFPVEHAAGKVVTTLMTPEWTRWTADEANVGVVGQEMTIVLTVVVGVLG